MIRKVNKGANDRKRVLMKFSHKEQLIEYILRHVFVCNIKKNLELSNTMKECMEIKSQWAAADMVLTKKGGS